MHLCANALVILSGLVNADAGNASLLSSGAKLPLWLKVVYTLFVCTLVPLYWRYYGPANFLWFSDLAVFGTLAALWLESPLVASVQAVSIGLLELLWAVDFLARLLVGVHVGGISKYMFKPEIPLTVRALSLFHMWLPLLLLWLVCQLGYDSRAWVVQCVVAVVVLLVCYFATEPSSNINWVYGPGDKPQQLMPSGLYLAMLMVFLCLGVYLPTHLLLRKFC